MTYRTRLVVRHPSGGPAVRQRRTEPFPVVAHGRRPSRRPTIATVGVTVSFALSRWRMPSAEQNAALRSACDDAGLVADALTLLDADARGSSPLERGVGELAEGVLAGAPQPDAAELAPTRSSGSSARAGWASSTWSTAQTSAARSRSRSARRVAVAGAAGAFRRRAAHAAGSTILWPRRVKRSAM